MNNSSAKRVNNDGEKKICVLLFPEIYASISFNPYNVGYALK
jgi:hypothetical protein